MASKNKTQSNSKPSDPIAIVGSSCRFPGGANSAASFWKLLESPRDVCQEIPRDRFDTTSIYHPNGNHHGSTNVRHSYFLDGQDVRQFDAAFFNISPNEADSMDPQQRLLLETVYEALEAGGHPAESLRGSDTAVYVGTMGVDYNDTLVRDLKTLPTYFATGTNRAIISNRVSYCFDWHGPSMTIDTACSSSLIAVHQGVAALRSGESRVAVACGTQVLLNPEMYIAESKMKMLSPTGRSRMWDAEADGYARGEGVAAVVLKRLSDAIADGDHIECLVRETGANQDGFSGGITVPSSAAQAALIRQTYARAGLDPARNEGDRPQFFEAHGTGTQAGDPREAEAIHQSLAQYMMHAGDAVTNSTAPALRPLYVGSVKTVIGHLEGSAGLAGLLKASAMIQHAAIPPNMLFNRLNPTIAPFYGGLQIPTKLTAWPALPEGVPRRVSVNSFGFGGTNAHAILEQYFEPESHGLNLSRDPDETETRLTVDATGLTPFTPFVFSAASEASLVAQLKLYSAHFKTSAGASISARDLAWTLQSRRSQHSIRTSFSAGSIQHLQSQIDAKLDISAKTVPPTAVGSRPEPKASSPRGVLGVFTGQGAQWPAMGAQLIRSSSWVRGRVHELQDALDTLPISDRPPWTLLDEMLAGDGSSRLTEAALSQPLCTVLQIILVDLLAAAGIRFSAVVGHSSGEIAAAYAAGYLSARDAVRVAYYRGFHAHLAGSDSATTGGVQSQKGAMLAVGTSLEDAQDLVGLGAFKGRLAVAAHNSPASVTLSGDADAITHAKKVFDEEKKFARFLKVDTAYHSHHMLPCGDPYVESLRACGVEVKAKENGDTTTISPKWYSSVIQQDGPMDPVGELSGVYWKDNMTKTVLFADAVAKAVADSGGLVQPQQLALAIEVGPHAALKGPVSQIASIPYCGALSRAQNDVEAFSDALGLVWTLFGGQGQAHGAGEVVVDFHSLEKTMTGGSQQQPRLVTGLPSYQWNHARSYWSESRQSRRARGQSTPSHEVLGQLSSDSNAHDMRWANVLKASEIPWLDGHKLQSQIVFPAAGYVAMALEASRSLAPAEGGGAAIQVFELHNLTIPRAITFDDGDSAGVETLVTLTTIQHHQDQTVTADFSCYSLPILSTGSDQEMELMASGSVKVVLGGAGGESVEALACELPEDYNMSSVDTDKFYASLDKLGYGYSGPFRTMSALRRRLNHSSAMVDAYVANDDENSDESPYIVHPSVLDVAFQASMLAYSDPGDERLWSLHVPTSIRSIRVNAAVCASLPTSGAQIPVCAVLDGASGSDESFCTSIDLFSEDGRHGMVQIGDLTLKPFAPATAADDRRLFSYTQLGVAVPEAASPVYHAGDAHSAAQEGELALVCERVAYYYLRKWQSDLTSDDWAGAVQRHQDLGAWASSALSAAAANGRQATLGWSGDSSVDIQGLVDKYRDTIDVELLEAIGKGLPLAVRGQTDALEDMPKIKHMLADYCVRGLGIQRYTRVLASVLKQIAHRYPHMRIIELGAGASGATSSVLESIGSAMSSYTYTDKSSDSFENAAVHFAAHSHRMTFKILDTTKSAISQGFESHSYDLVVASRALQTGATASLQTALETTRQLLKPGGYLVLLETTDQAPVHMSTILGRLGIRGAHPVLMPGEWHTMLRSAGFSGVDTISPQVDGAPSPFSVMVSQAVDERVQFLRRPLIRESPASIRIRSLVILGNQTLRSARIAEEVAEHLGRFCEDLVILKDLPTAEEADGLDPQSTFLNLTDLDSPVFRDMTADRMDGLKRMFEGAVYVLWITQGALAHQPYHMASVAFLRSLRNEAKHISLNTLDLSNLQGDNTCKSIAEYLLQQNAIDEWEATTSGNRQGLPLWSKEPEAFLDARGRLQVPRLLSKLDQNERFNSTRRATTKVISLSSSKVSISLSADLQPTLVHHIRSGLPSSGHQMELFRIKSSSLMALQIAANTFLYLSIGSEKHDTAAEGGGKTSLIVSTTNSSETVPVARVAVEDLSWSGNADAMLISTASEILAGSLVRGLFSGGRILVHCSGKHRFLAAALSRRAAGEGLGVIFTCDAKEGRRETSPTSSANANASTQDPVWLKLDARMPMHALRKMLLLARPTHFLDLTKSIAATGKPSSLSCNILQALPVGVKVMDLFTLFQREACLPAAYSREGLEARLEDAVSSATWARAAQDQEHDPRGAVHDVVMQLDSIYESSPVINDRTTTTVHWPSNGQVTVRVRPLDARELFSPDKTYLLVGLSGKIGQSLCEWMVSHGAGRVVLTSRRPKVDQRWLDSLNKPLPLPMPMHGRAEAVKTSCTRVEVVAMDVTDKDSVERVVAEIRASWPEKPIAGVANGAMVLRDALFSNMSAEAMREGLEPKVLGSNNLDDVFRNEALDFFVMFSSSSSIIGNPGQSNYAAANGYLSGLARQRRRRGLAASTFDIGRVAGIGFLETADQAVIDQLTNFGLSAISESDFRQAFAETIQAGYPCPGDGDGGEDDHNNNSSIPDAVLTTGIRIISDDEDIKGPWFSNPFFSHCVVDSGNTESDTAGDKLNSARLPVNQRLAKAVTTEEALEILEESFSARLRVILQSTDQETDPNLPLVDLGIDSLVAVEVRSWFLKELKVDIPVLKVVGGASIAELCQIVLEKLPEKTLSNIGNTKTIVESEPRVHAMKTSPAVTQGPVKAKPTDSSSISASTSTVVSSLSTPASGSESGSASSLTSSGLSSQTTPAPPRPRKFLKSEPISLGQSRFWYLSLLLQDQRTSNVAFYYHVAGELRIGDLERAIRVVTSRHEALRTCFVAAAAATPSSNDSSEADVPQAYQKVLPSSLTRLERIKIDSHEAVPAEFAKLQDHEFALTDGSLLRLVLLTLSPSEHYLMFSYHHIIMDGVSFQVFLSDLEKAYDGHSLGALPRQYPEISVAQRQAYEQGGMAEELKYWQSVFPAGQQPPVLPLLPMARTSSRAPLKTFETHQVVAKLGPELAARIKQVSKAQRSSPFHFYLAVFKSMLFLFTEAQDLTIGIADAARNDADVADSVGFFLNLLTLRFRRQAAKTFSEAVNEARDVAHEALRNSRLPFDVLLAELNVARSSTYSPFFQAFLDYRQGAQVQHPWGNTQFDFCEMHPGRTSYDITLDVTDSATDALVMFRVQSSLYDTTGAELLLETYTHLLEVLSSDPSISLESTQLFSQDQLHRAVQVGCGPRLPSEWPETLPHRIDQVAQQNQDKVALLDGTGKPPLTYAAMTGRIQAISEALHEAHVGTGARVIVFQEAAADWVCSMLAIMRVGAIYVPLDLRNPLPRLAAVARDCDPAAILADASTLPNVRQLDTPHAKVIDVSSLFVKAFAPEQFVNLARPDSPAAYLYTSGSTGVPKAIVVTHAGLRNEVEGYTRAWKLGGSASGPLRTLQQSAFTFNHSSDQIYTGLVNGGSVYIVPSKQRGDPLEITRIIRDFSISYTKATPSEYSMWIQYGGEAHLRGQALEWRFAFGGGEPLTAAITNEFADLELPQLRFFNSYGPTEISISSHKKEVHYCDREAVAAMGRIPCGYSLPNYHTYVVDEELKPLPIGMPGEVCIGGAGVSLGYLGNKELTDRHFVPNPFVVPGDNFDVHGWTRMFRTGDIGHLRADGAMVFHNRIEGDTQVKIRGLRIELSDIEANILAASDGALKEAVVTLRSGDSDEFLVAHVVFALHDPPHLASDEQAAFLRNLLGHLQLPQYMIPVVAISLDKLPLTNHSKVDRKAIKNMALPMAISHISHDEDEPATETMNRLKRVWRDVLGKDNERLGLDLTSTTSFFLVGGNSLLAIRLQSRIRAVFNVVIRLVELLDAQTLGDMSRKIEEGANIDGIDWEAETAPPHLPSFLTDMSSAEKTTEMTTLKTIIVTGATSFLAKFLLPQLERDPQIATIHCIAVRDKDTEQPRNLPVSGSPKIVVHRGDLSLPLLGLSEDTARELSLHADAIFHLGGVRSFWDNYHALRRSNVHPTRELIKLAAPRRVPIHYISTVGVLPATIDAHDGAAAASAAAHPPAVDGTDGYVASRWASERLLERAAEALGVPSTVYRFLPVAEVRQEDTSKVLDEFVRLVDAAGQLPDTGGWSGRMDMLPAEAVARSLCVSLLADVSGGPGSGSASSTTRFVHYESQVAVQADEMAAYLERKRGGQGLEYIPILRWIGRIKALGFDFFLTTQDATVESQTRTGAGQASFKSRR